MAELSDAVLGLVSLLLLSYIFYRLVTIKHLHGSQCWSIDACYSCAPVAPATAIIATTEV